MAIYPNAPENASPSLPDDEVINFRPLLGILLKWWREIFLLTILAAAIGGLVVLYSRANEVPLYEASAQVAIARIVSNVSLDDTFRTAMNGVGASLQDGNARRTALIGLVTNNSIANAVSADLSATFGTLSPARLSKDVSASFVGGSVSDLIQIAIVADDPEKAAAIANSWARYYVEHVNTLYGEMPIEMAEVVELELEKARRNYDAAQIAYEATLAENDIPTLNRQITEKQNLIDLLQDGRQLVLQGVISQTLGYRQNVVATYLDSIQQNRLLALTGEQEANRALVEDLILSIKENRQLAFKVEHEARVQLFTQYADRELDNRLLALQQEQAAKTQIFQRYSAADLDAKLAVFNEQVNSKVGGLVASYADKEHVNQLLDQAIALQQQIEAAGDAGATTNSLPLLLLKIEAFAITQPTANNASDGLQLDLTGENSLETDFTKQATDIAVLIETLRVRSEMLAARIEEESLSLYNNEGYQLLGNVRPEDDALFDAIQEQYLALFQVDELAQSADNIAEESLLSQAITAKYNALFGLSSLANDSLAITDTTSVYTTVVSQFPSLFQVGDLTLLRTLLSSDSTLDSAGQQQILELLQTPSGLESYAATETLSAQPILQLEEEIRQLQATLERKTTELQRGAYTRDLALEAYETLSNKLVEFTLQRTASNREVRLAATANPPANPIPKTSLLQAGAIFAGAGFLVAVIIVFLAAYMNAQPFLSRFRLPHPRSASHVTH